MEGGSSGQKGWMRVDKVRQRKLYWDNDHDLEDGGSGGGEGWGKHVEVSRGEVDGSWREARLHEGTSAGEEEEM